MLTPDFQGEGKAFGPPVAVSPDSGPLDRLLGLSGVTRPGRRRPDEPEVVSTCAGR